MMASACTFDGVLEQEERDRMTPKERNVCFLHFGSIATTAGEGEGESGERKDVDLFATKLSTKSLRVIPVERARDIRISLRAVNRQVSRMHERYVRA